MSNIKSGEMFDYYECQAVTVVVHVVQFRPFSWLRHVSHLRRVSIAGCQRILVCGCGLKQITTSSSTYSFIYYRYNCLNTYIVLCNTLQLIDVDFSFFLNNNSDGSCRNC